jgi:pimeloyl-CoA dehydrogenase
MDLRLTPAQEAFRDEVRRFIAERLPADIREHLRMGHVPRREDFVRWQRILNERGCAAPHWRREYGGAELGEVERLLLQDELYSACAPQALHFIVTMLGPVLIRFGTPEQKRHRLPLLANLDVWFCQGFSEPGSRRRIAAH